MDQDQSTKPRPQSMRPADFPVQSDTLDDLFEAGPVMMHSINAAGELVRISRHFARRLGYRRAEMIGRRLTDFMTSDSQALAANEYVPEFFSSGCIQNAEYDFVHRNGDRVPVLLSAGTYYDANGRFLNSIAVLFDNTEAQAARASQESVKAKARFLAAMSHEIRTPMNAILGYAQLLRRTDLDDSQVPQLDAIVSSGNNLVRLLSDLLDLSRLEAGTIGISPQPFDTRKLIHQTAELWQSAAQEKGLKLRTTIDRHLPPRIYADAGRIQQVLNNLLSNAIKFSDKGTVTLKALDRSSDTGTRLRFEVSDTGPGIEPEFERKLFSPYVQFDSNTARNHGGWGLGLSICQFIATLLHAKIGVITKPGEGSTFHLELPVEPLRASSDTARERNQDAFEIETPGRVLRILTAEDNDLNQDVIKSMVNALGHETIIVPNGFEAVNALQEQDFDLVLMDISMPGLDGVGATKQIRSLPGRNSRIPIVALTGDSTHGARDTYLSSGMNDYLSKPISLGDLQATIRRLVLKDQSEDQGPSAG